MDSVSSTSLSHLKEILNTCSLQAIETDDHRKPEDAVSDLVEFINYIHGAIISCSDDDECSKQIAMEILTELLCFISSPSLNQVVVDALSFELPKSVVKFACVSNKFCEIAECVIVRLISTCNPRDMLTVICEVLDSPCEMFKEPAYFIPLLSGLSKVFTSLQRRYFEHIKEALPAVLNVLQAVSSELDDEILDSFMVLIGRGILIATSIQEVCQKLEGRQTEQLRALLGIFVLETMALVSSTLVDTKLHIPLMSQLTQFLPFCNLSYHGLVTGEDVEASTVILGAENGDYMRCFSHVKEGAVIAVVWGIIPEIAKVADEDLSVLRDNLRNSQNKRWQTVGMLKYVLSSIDQPWQVKEHSIDFLLSIVEGNVSRMSSSENANSILHFPNIFAAVQAIEMVIIYAPHAVLRKKAFIALKMMLADIPTHRRFDILKASITNNSYSSMVAILIDLVKEELFMEYNRNGLRKRGNIVTEGDKIDQTSPFWRKDVLKLVEFVLRPPKGGHPSLPEQSDLVLSALNLYRFLLITESTGKTNYTEILAKNSLQKAYTEWFLPLRTLISGIMVQNEECFVAVDEVCGLNPLQLVLDRCIELTEDKLQHTV